MPTVSVILVKQRNGSLQFMPLPLEHRHIRLEGDADNALEQVRRYFDEKWRSTVHALRWLHPEQMLIPGNGETEVLVLHVDATGQLPIADGSADISTHNQRNPDIDPLVCAAILPSPCQPWSNPDWLTAMSEWIAATFSTNCVTRIAQIRVCFHGAVLKLQGPGGNWFLKTVHSAFASEVGLLQVLAKCLPGACPSVLSLSPDPNTHITSEVLGRPLRVIHDPMEWKAALRQVANLQRESTRHIAAIRATGAPFQSFTDFATRLEETIARLLEMQRNAPNQLATEDLDRFGFLIENARRDCDVLARCNLPEALVHGDLQESNIFRTSGGNTILIDWSSSQVAHPFFALASTVFASYASDHPMHEISGELRDAYLEPWYDYSTANNLLAGLDAASRLVWINVTDVVAAYVRRVQGELPGTIAFVPRVLRRALSALVPGRLSDIPMGF